MSNVQSYNALIDRFKAFASGHFILKTFSHGQIDTADLEKFTEYPFMHVVPSNVTYAKGTKTFSFQIVLADLPRDKDDKVEFQKEVLSDLQRIAEDLVAEITNHRVLFGDLITVQNVTLEPFLEEFHNTLTGWTVSLELLVPYYWDACSIPAEWNTFFEGGSSGGESNIFNFAMSIQDTNGQVTLVNDEETPAPNYYYGTNGAGVRGWYLLSDEVGLTCATIGTCQTIIDIEAAIDALEEEILLKADISSISAVGFSNDYTDLDNKPTIPAAQVNSDWNAVAGVAQILNKPTIPAAQIQSDWTQANNVALDFIKNKPTIPAAQVNSDWNATSGVAQILNKPTLTNGTVTSVGVTAGTGISVSGSPITSSGSITVTNSAPDQVVGLTAGSGIAVTGTYPNFTITNNAPSGGTVTAVTATAPMSSTGGATPNLSMSSANGTTNGYLLSSDWLIFNGKFNTPTGTTLQYVRGDGSLATFPSLTGYVPYTGATTNVDLGTHTLSAKDLVINHSSGSGVAASITKGGAGEALTVNKTSGSGNAMSVTGGVTQLDELHLTTDLADAYIASAATWNAKVPSTRTISTTAPLSGGGDLSANRTLSMPAATTLVDGYLSATDWTTFNNKQAALVSGTNIKTINSTTLLGSGNIAVEPTITAGTTGQYYRGDKTFQTLDKTAVGLANVDNTSDASKPISTATQTALNAKQGTITLTTTGTSGASTLVGNTLNIPQYIGGVTSVTGTAPVVSSGGTTPAISMPAATSLVNGYLSSADWTTFNNKQAALVSATNIKTINSTSLLGSGNIAVEPTITAGTTGQYYRGDKTFQTLDKTAVGLANVDNTSDLNKPISTATQTALNAKQATLVSATNIKTINGNSILGSGDLVVSGGGGGTVTSVAALTLGTTGTNLSSTVANGTTTPVITLNVPDASATNRGALTAANWTTFNNKQNALTLTTTGTSGAATLVGATLNVPQYTTPSTLSLTQLTTGSLIFSPSAAPAYNGEIVKFGTGSLTAGQLYYLNSSGVWTFANATAAASSTGMLGIAVGASPTADGLLVRGYAVSTLYTQTTGSIIYIATTGGNLTETAPSTSTQVVRVVGYKTSLANTIYISPDPTWLVLA
jgi:hypothetical protein